ncbi:tetratricopeptide repeat protein, partial [Chelatococcus reniformis]|uniref:tetratricopeptide repeat protein n=1 Tax=Chelatococcus reniformis TaxID=1494448 RepID=UPI0016657704
TEQPEHAEALLERGELARREGHLDQALELVIAALCCDPSKGYQLARGLLEELGTGASVGDKLQALLQLHPSNLNIVRLFCLHARKQNNPRGMEEALKGIVAAEPNDNAIRLLCAQELHRVWRHEAAWELLAPLIEAQPGNRTLVLTAGDIASSRRDYAAAAAYLARAAELSDGELDNRSRLRLAAALKHLNQTQAAADALAPVLAQPDAPAQAHEEAGHIARQRGDLPGMVQHYSAAAAADPSSARLRLVLVRALRDAGQVERAATLLDALLTEQPEHAEALLERGE